MIVLALQAFALPHDVVVSLGVRDRFHCTGVLIAHRTVLTAAHCLPVDEVRVGPAWEGGASRGVADVHRHPVNAIDAAVLVLDEPVEIEPARLLLGEAPLSGPLRLVAFGAGSARSDVGHRHELTWAAPSPACDAVRAARTGCDPRFEWALGPSDGGEDSCAGDSGGPLFREDEDGAGVVALVARGIVSRRRSCGDGGVYTRLGALAPWLVTWLEE